MSIKRLTGLNLAHNIVDAGLLRRPLSLVLAGLAVGRTKFGANRVLPGKTCETGFFGKILA